MATKKKRKSYTQGNPQIKSACVKCGCEDLKTIQTERLQRSLDFHAFGQYIGQRVGNARKVCQGCGQHQLQPLVILAPDADPSRLKQIEIDEGNTTP